MELSDSAEEKEPVDCAACGRSSEDAFVVGTRARFGMAVRNVACRFCGLVYVSPRLTQRALDAYYATQYRAHYHGVKIPAPGGGVIGPEDEGFAEVWRERHRSQALGALKLGEPPRGGRVLEVGCGDGTTLRFVRDLGQVEVAGIEPDVREAAVARERGLDCFTGPMESYDNEGAPFDQVQMFHVLEHLRDPLAALTRLSSWLGPKGRLVIEVPNATRPYGLLEGNFFQNAHLFSFSANTLGVLFRRAGLKVGRVVDGGSLFMVGERDPAVDRGSLPLPFKLKMLAKPEQDGSWTATRLSTYRDLERMRQTLFSERLTTQRLDKLARLLRQPSFRTHLIESVSDLAARALELEAFRVALIILRAASAGPHEKDITEAFATHAIDLRTKMEEIAA